MLLVPSNYRSISNFPFLSKLLERIVSRRITDYLPHNDLLPRRQSIYRRERYLETALTNVLTDLTAALDRGGLGLLARLDFSAAFDTVNHSVQRARLVTSFGRWFLCVVDKILPAVVHSRSHSERNPLHNFLSTTKYHRDQSLDPCYSSSTLLTLVTSLLVTDYHRIFTWTTRSQWTSGRQVFLLRGLSCASTRSMPAWLETTWR